MQFINCITGNTQLCVNYFFRKVVYSTSRPSGNQVDGLPFVLHNTRAVVLGLPLPPALSGSNLKNLYCEIQYNNAFTMY